METIRLLRTEPRRSGTGPERDPVLNPKTQGPTMKQVYLRRSTDTGYVPPRRSTLQVLRRVLGLATVSESLSDLSHWRRRRPAAAKNAGK